MPRSRHAWWLYLALMAPVAVAYLAGPLNAGPVFNLIGFSACIAILLGVRINRPAARWPWYLIALGQFLFVTGDVLAYNYKAFFGQPLPFPSVADPFYLAVYPVTVAGLLLLIRHRNPGRDWASLIDAAIVTIGLALLSWVFLISPYAHDHSLALGTKLVSIAYPTGDILMLGVAVRMAVGAGRRSVAYYMVIAAIAGVLVTDSVYGWILLHGTYHPGDPLDGGWIVYYVLWGAAALHPSMTSVSQADARPLKLTRTRILAIAAAALVAPVIEVVKASARHDSDALIVAAASIVLFGLVVVRMIGLAREQGVTAARERTMRRATGALVTATSATEIVRAAQDAVAIIAGPDALPTVLAIEAHDADHWLVGADPRGGSDEIRLPLSALAQEVVDQLVRRVPVEISDGREAFGLGPGPPPAFAVPILAQGELAGVVALLNATATSHPARDSLESLAAQVGLALESAALTKRGLRRESDLRLSALVQHSTDVILVLAPDMTVEYVSPSIAQILGYDPEDFAGRRLSDYVFEADLALLDSALGGVLAHASQNAEALEFRVAHCDGRLLHTECLVTNLLDDAAVGGIVVNLRDITERKQFEEQLTYQAFHDPITKLANRALFRDRVEHALRRRRDRGQPVAVLFLDLDDFKTINDTFGHVAGDRLLQTIASRLESALRVGDTVARLGGDEFSVLLDDVAHETEVSAIVEHLLDEIGAPLVLEEREISVQCSIGIAAIRLTGDAQAALTETELLRNADVAMYQAKAAGGNTYRYFKPEMQASVVSQLELRRDLKAAIGAEELTLAYQPIFDLATGEISGYEALLRWVHAVRGNVSPATFIPVAEESGMIIALGRWVLERACRDAVAFQKAATDQRRRAVSVNISARQLERVEIVDEVRNALRTSGLEPACLLLEITESLMIDDVELAIERLSALRELGVLVAVDDFGTGYSSLNYIRRLPINILKIDKQFIDSVDGSDKDSKLTAAIIGMARVLELRCVAEGVERPSQHARLRELGCDYAQGFLLARPMSADALAQLLGAPEPAAVPAS
jgi:diguanylate cyclase (GGDEF)-like protein/PAS domain S-box-containing protein